MATRSNVKINDANTGAQIWIYRHWDGYPAGGGADLAKVIRRITRLDFSSLANELLRLQRPATKYSGPEYIYEVTDGEHGDIEWRYDVSLHRNQGFSITVRERSAGGSWKEHPARTIQEFRDFCAKDICDIRKRYFDRKKKGAVA